MIHADTILALSSPPGGDGPRAILRLSGPHAHALAFSLLEPAPAFPAKYPACVGGLNLRSFPAGNALAAILLFQAPRSFTGEDVAELHLPNSPAIVRWATDALLAAARTRNIPARFANPGEFSARAFFSGKIDLTEAEGIAATINAQNESQLRAAASLRQGDLHRWIAATSEKLADVLALVEAEIDFVEEEGVRFVGREKLSDELTQAELRLYELLSDSVRIDQLGDLPAVVFIGQPNVGKSSLINALAGQERSIISPIAGTTRDMLSVIMHTPQGDVRLLDVPGEEPPLDELRTRMMEARQNALLDADLIIEVVSDDTKAVSTLAQRDDLPATCFTVQNKADLLPADQLTAVSHFEDTGEEYEIRKPWQLVSAKTGLHLEELRNFLMLQVGRREQVSRYRLVLNHRHRHILQEAKAALADASRLADGYSSHPELLAADLRRALDLLGQITGTISPDDVLGRIFSQFCIGK